MSKSKRQPSKRRGGNGGRPLKICLLSYRGNPTSGGQGVYIKYLSRALRDLGHEVDVISGPPYPELAENIILHPLPGLDLYNPDHLFRVAEYRDLLKPLNQLEFLSMCSGGFPEPYTFGRRVYEHLRRKRPDYDIIHDNQCLASDLLRIPSLGFPMVATIHHPITVDRDMELAAAPNWYKRMKVKRWYAFLGMQVRVSRRLSRIITVSECSKKDISREFGVSPDKFRVVPNGINTDFFYPLSGVERKPHHLLVTNSADTPLKGLKYLLLAVNNIRKRRSIHLTVIGKPKKDGMIEHLVEQLGVKDVVHFTGRIEYEDFARYYAEATMAVIPSLYEGFGMPAGEAMACGVPVISTTGGALPEVVGDAGVLVPPGDSEALEKSIDDLLDDPQKRLHLGQAGLKRVGDSLTWEHAAKKTIAIYQEEIHAHRRLS
ncbi:MAG: D-inositol 3-phosphate glycosyltransferase [Syntrophus sp. SKADARSKE-3]|nr:D-inositol 3-phosphate glycosyltransferase [Syntrophus sp. SKADARSKE-3]